MAILNNQMVYIINMKWFTTMIYDMIITVTTQRSFCDPPRGVMGFSAGTTNMIWRGVSENGIDRLMYVK